MQRKEIVKGLTGSSKTFYIAKQLLEEKLKPPLLIITPSLKDAENIFEELRLFLPQDYNLQLYPPWDVKPYDLLTPHLSRINKRINVLWQLINSCPIIVAPITSLLQKVIPKNILENSKIHIAINESVDLTETKKQLLLLGYRQEERVVERGNFSIRGNILDIYSPNFKLPARIELFGDEVITIRNFTPNTQRSGDQLKEIDVIPNRDVLLFNEYISNAQKEIKEHADSVGIKKPDRDKWIMQLKDGVYPREVDRWLPFFYEKLEDPLSYLAETGTLILVDEANIYEEIERFEKLCSEGFEKARKDLRLIPSINRMYTAGGMWKNKVGELHSVVQIEPLKRKDIKEGTLISTIPITGISPISHRTGVDPLKPFLKQIREWKYNGNQIIIVCHTKEQIDRLREILALHNFDLSIIEQTILEKLTSLSGKEKTIYATLGFLSKGFEYPSLHLVFLAEEEIFGVQRKRRPRATKEVREAAFFSSIEQLKEGDLVVHIEHGIGKYGGLKQIKHGAQKEEFLLISYKGDDRLFLPVHKVNLLQKYLGHEKGRPPLDSLGGSSWEKRRKKVKKCVEELAHELLKLYAEREMTKGFAFSSPDNLFLEFESEFEFEETEDQQQAIEDVIEDMCNKRPMDRLVCGDVGYGKTEVAMRAAFKSLLDQKQVAIVCPTTLLASQHERTFKERFSKFPVTVELLSRFRTSTEKKNILKKLQSAEIDIIIGTHALFSKNIKFNNLGLVIIDEEQRFGVKQKEQLKSLRTEVDVLTLTATPIPRTLSFTLSGLRDLSTINTPPADRRSVQTFVTPFNEEIIRNALLEELKRGGDRSFLFIIVFKR